MSAHEFDEQLNAYIDGVLSDEERRTVEERLAADPDARKRLSELRAVVDALHALPRAKAPSDLAGAVMAQVQPAPKVRRFSTLGLFTRGVALAAACILVAWGVSLVLRQKERAGEEAYELARTDRGLTQAQDAEHAEPPAKEREEEAGSLDRPPETPPAPLVAMQRADVERDTVALGTEQTGGAKTPDAFDHQEEAPAASRLKRHVAEVAAQAPSDELLASACKEEAAREDGVKGTATLPLPAGADEKAGVAAKPEKALAKKTIDALAERAPAQAGRITDESAVRRRARAAGFAKLERAQALSRARMAGMLSAQGYGQLAAILTGTYRAGEAAFNEKEIAADLSAGMHPETLEPGRFTNIFFVETPSRALAVKLSSNQADVAANRENLSSQGALHVYYQTPNGRFAPLPEEEEADADQGAAETTPAAGPANNLIVIVPQETKETE